MTTLLIAEHDNNNISDSVRKAITAAKEIGETVDILVAGKDCNSVADEAAKISGVNKVLICDNDIYSKHLAEPYADLIVSLASNYNTFIAPATTTSKNYMPRVAALLDVPQVSDIISVIDNQTFEHPIYAGNAIETVKLLSEKKVITVRATAFQASEDQEATDIEAIDSAANPGLSEYISE